MARKTEKKKIGETEYEVQQFGARKGREVLFTLTTMLGPAAAGFLKGGLSEGGILAAIQAFSETAKVEDFSRLCDEFASCTTVHLPTITGQPLKVDLSKVFDDHFAGAYGDMLAWLAFAIGVNYSNFFALTGPGNAGSSLLEALGVRKSESPSPKG